MNADLPLLKLLRMGVCGLAFLGSSAANAEDGAPADHLAANIALTSDYRFRGVSYSGSQPALQGGLTLAEDPGWFAGIWSSVALAGSHKGDEIDLFAGRTGKLRGLDYSLAVYLYMDGAARHIQYAEFQALLTRNIGRASLQLEASSAPTQQPGTASNLYLAATALIPLRDPRLTVNLHAGRENGFFDHKIDWEAGLSYRLSALTLSAAAVGSTQASRRQLGKTYTGGTSFVLSAVTAF